MKTSNSKADRERRSLQPTASMIDLLAVEGRDLFAPSALPQAPAGKFSESGCSQAKILFYIPALDRGGPDRVFYEVIRQLSRSGLKPALLVNRSGGEYWQRLKDERLELHSLDASTRFPMRQFADFVKESQFRTVCCTLDSIVTASLANQFYRLKLTVVSRPANHLTRSSLELAKKNPIKYGAAWLMNVFALHSSHHIVCQSADIRRDLRRYLLPTHLMTVIGNPISIGNAPDRGLDTQDKLRIVSLGRLSNQKGYDILIDAAALLPNSIREQIRIEIYGDGPDRDALANRIIRKRVSSFVSLCGYTTDARGVLDSSQFFISSSRYEGFPNAVLEALATGVSIIATDCPGGTRDIVVPNKNGWLCRAESSKDLADAIKLAVQSGPFASDRIRSWVEENWSPRIIGDKFVAVFQNLQLDSVGS